MAGRKLGIAPLLSLGWKVLLLLLLLLKVTDGNFS
jgi:hypothetical protein